MFDKKLATHLASLSKIRFTEKELDTITNEMDTIVALMDTVADFEESSHTIINSPTGLQEIRPDCPKPSDAREDILSNAKGKSDTCFTVPKVV